MPSLQMRVQMRVGAMLLALLLATTMEAHGEVGSKLLWRAFPRPSFPGLTAPGYVFVLGCERV